MEPDQEWIYSQAILDTFLVHSWYILDTFVGREIADQASHALQQSISASIDHGVIDESESTTAADLSSFLRGVYP